MSFYFFREFEIHDDKIPTLLTDVEKISDIFDQIFILLIYELYNFIKLVNPLLKNIIMIIFCDYIFVLSINTNFIV
jgi:hypothetical protein